MTSIVVFDYGFGNVRSMVRAVANLGVDVELTSDVDKAMAADGVVVPGVGAFAACVEGLRRAGGDGMVYDRLRERKPVLGVCVGLQVMFDTGYEGGVPTEGLGVLGGSVRQLKAPVVPQMGWNTVDAAAGSTLLKGVERERFYFVHSYCVSDPTPEGRVQGLFEPDDEFKVTWCDYGSSRFAAAVERGPLSITQFHPEKSAQAGATLLRNWVDSFAATR